MTPPRERIAWSEIEPYGAVILSSLQLLLKHGHADNDDYTEGLAGEGRSLHPKIV